MNARKRVQGRLRSPSGGWGERAQHGGGPGPLSGVWGSAPSITLEQGPRSGRPNEATVGEIVTPWRLEDYARSLDDSIKTLNGQIAQSGKVQDEIKDVNGFDIFGFLTWISHWQLFYAEIGVVDEWVQPGTTYNVVERYHFQYIDWRRKAIERHLVNGFDPMSKPRPYEEPGPIIPPVFGPNASTDMKPWFGLAAIVAGGYLLNAIAANRKGNK